MYDRRRNGDILSSIFEDEMWHCGVDVARTGG